MERHPALTVQEHERLAVLREKLQHAGNLYRYATNDALAEIMGDKVDKIIDEINAIYGHAEAREVPYARS